MYGRDHQSACPIVRILDSHRDPCVGPVSRGVVPAQTDIRTAAVTRSGQNDRCALKAARNGIRSASRTECRRRLDRREDSIAQ